MRFKFYDNQFAVFRCFRLFWFASTDGVNLIRRKPAKSSPIRTMQIIIRNSFAEKCESRAGRRNAQMKISPPQGGPQRTKVRISLLLSLFYIIKSSLKISCRASKQFYIQVKAIGNLRSNLRKIASDDSQNIFRCCATCN